jgi:hypothetical protein
MDAAVIRMNNCGGDIGLFEDAWPIKTTEAGNTGYDCSEPVGIEVFQERTFFRASPMGNVEIKWTAIVVWSVPAVKPH